MSKPSFETSWHQRDGSRLWHIGLLSVLLLAAYLSYVGTLADLFGFMVNSHIEQVARAYIKSTLHEAARMLEILSATKAALALLQSSSGGISFVVDVQIQLGQVLNALSEFIARAWLVSLAAVAALEGLELLLDLSKLSFAPVLTLFFVALGLSQTLRSRAPRPALAISHVARLALFAALVVHFVIPLAIYGTAAASNICFHPQRERIRQGFKAVHAITPKHRSGVGLHKEVKSVIEKLTHSRDSMHGQTSAVSRLTADHFLYSVAEHLVVPLVLMMMLWSTLRQILEKLWSRRPSSVDVLKKAH